MEGEVGRNQRRPKGSEKILLPRLVGGIEGVEGRRSAKKMKKSHPRCFSLPHQIFQQLEKSP